MRHKDRNMYSLNLDYFIVTALIGMSLASLGNISNYNDLLLGNRKDRNSKILFLLFDIEF